MDFHTASFFCDSNQEPTCYVDIDNNDKFWPVSLQIEEVYIYFSSVQDLINFKNSFLGSYEKAMREAKDA